jgi:hypothetical protein
MTIRSNHVLLAGIFTLLSTTGCSALEEGKKTLVFDIRQTEPTAKAEISKWFPVGSSMEGARQGLQSSGFKCSPSEVPSAGLKGLLCQLDVPDPVEPPVARMGPVSWIVFLDESKQGTIEKISVDRVPPESEGRL